MPLMVEGEKEERVEGRLTAARRGARHAATRAATLGATVVATVLVAAKVVVKVMDRLYLILFRETRCGLPYSQWGLPDLSGPPGCVVRSVW